MVFSNAVIQHVPPTELRAYFQSLTSLIASGAMALVIFVSGPDGERYQGMNWRYSPEALTMMIGDVDDDIEASVEDLDDDHAALTGRDKKLLRLRRRS